jgi:hypothetical protein
MDSQIKWKTDRKDLVEAVRTLPAKRARSLYVKHVGGATKGKPMQDVYNEIMLAVLDGRIPHDAVT